MSKALGDATREEALCFVKSNNFPMKGAKKVIDLYDDTGIPQDTAVDALAENSCLKGKLAKTK
jgi:hypothetical protein